MRFRAQAGRAPLRWWTAAAVCSLALAVHPRVGYAQGFGLNEIGSCAIARGYAATGAPCNDASTLYWNPAYTTQLPGLSAYIGASSIAVRGDFTADTTGRVDKANPPAGIPPFVGVNWTPKSARYALGAALYVPYGLTSQWKDDFPGRFNAQKAAIQTFYVQPNVSIAIVPGKLSIGGGPTFGHTSLELRQAIDFSQQRVPSATVPQGTTFAQLGFAPGTQIGTAKIKGSATGVGFNVGAFAQLTPTFSAGVRYLSKIEFKADDGDATFTQTPSGRTLAANGPLTGPTGQPLPGGTSLDAVVASNFAAGGPLTAQKVKTTIPHPAQVQVGIGFTGLANTTLSLDYEMTQWSAFKELVVDFQGSAPDRTLYEDYRNTNSVRVGLEHRFTSGALNGVAGRLGYAYAQGAPPAETVTPLLPDMDRNNYGVGVGLPLGGRFALDASYLYVDTKGRRGRTGERTSRSQTAAQINNGFFTLDANIFSLSLKAHF